MIRSRFTALCLSLCLLLPAVLGGAAAARGESFTFFKGTQYPLTVYWLRGAEPGPTVLVQGGIQGDETAGFLTAQLVARCSVRKGNLIVVPRANIPSVQQHTRQVNVDLNRRFDKDYNAYYEDRLARVIRYLLASCNAFIHLHEGSGFYHPTYVDSLRNPKRYGQSIIIDTKTYKGRVFLEQFANKVLDRLNPTVMPASFRFRLFNTNTFATDSHYSEQRKSLTYYALNRHCIPALAIEVSKDIIQVDWKVRQQLKATKLFLDAFGVQVDLPDINDQEIKNYAKPAPRIRVNGQDVGPKTKEVTLQALAPVRVEADVPQSVFSPVPSVTPSDGTAMDMVRTPRFALSPFRSLRVRSDGKTLARIPVAWKGSWSTSEQGKPLFVCWLNNSLRFVPAGTVLETVEGDQLRLEGIWGQRKEEIVNVKGLVTGTGRNDGQDAGCEIILDPGMFIQRYVGAPEQGQGTLCRVVRETKGKKRDQFHIVIRPRRISALRLRASNGTPVFLPWNADQTHRITPGEFILDGCWSNGRADKILVMIDGEPHDWGSGFRIGFNENKTITLMQATTFQPIGSMELSAASVASVATPPSSF